VVYFQGKRGWAMKDTADKVINHAKIGAEKPLPDK
jgi:hypothetical protein